MPSLLKRIRQRFGIAAPRLMVRTHVAWYWRWLGIVVVAAVSLALAAWIYDAGRHYAGHDVSAGNELAALKNAYAQLQRDAADARALANSSDARLRIEQATQTQLAAQMKALENENTRLKEDLAFFDGLDPGGHRAGDQNGGRLSIQRFAVEQGDQPGQYRYRLLIVLGGRRDREFQGTVQIVPVPQQAGRNAMIAFTQGDSATGTTQRLGFRFFQRLEGQFQVSDPAVRGVQVKVYENGSSEARAIQSASLPQAASTTQR